MADKIRKTVPNELDSNSRYAIRVRSVNAFGTPSDWSESTIINTVDSSSSTSGRLVLTANGMIAYDSNGQTKFVYSGENTGTRTNLVKNPSFEVNTTGWAATTGSSISRNLSDFYVGSDPNKASLKVTATTKGTLRGATLLAADRISATPGNRFTVSAYVKALVSPVSLKIGIAFYDAGNSLIKTDYNDSPVLVSISEWTRISNIDVLAPNLTSKIDITIVSDSEMSIGQAYLVDGVLLEQSSTLGDYFDGSTSIGATKWTGTSDYSTSTFDLTSSYYVDGGVFTSGTVQTAVDVGTGSPYGKAGVKMSTTGIQGYSGDQATPSFSLDTTGKFRVGNLAKYMYWNGSELTVKGAINGTDFNLLNASDQVISSLGPSTTTNFGNYPYSLVFDNLDDRVIQNPSINWSQGRKQAAITAVSRGVNLAGGSVPANSVLTIPGHTFLIGDNVSISGATPTTWNTGNIIYSVVNKDATRIEIAFNPGVNWTSGGSVLSAVDHQLSLAGPFATGAAFAITAASVNGGLLQTTITIPGHTFAVNDIVSIFGVNPSSWNVQNRIVAAVTTSTIRIDAWAPTAWVSGGYVGYASAKPVEMSLYSRADPIGGFPISGIDLITGEPVTSLGSTVKILTQVGQYANTTITAIESGVQESYLSVLAGSGFGPAAASMMAYDYTGPSTAGVQISAQGANSSVTIDANTVIIDEAIVGRWNGNTSYHGIFNNLSTAGSYVIMQSNNGSTFVSTGSSTGDIFLRPGNNSTTYQLSLDGTGGLHSLNGSLAFASGTTTAPSITFQGDTNTGIYRNGADDVRLVSAGVWKHAAVGAFATSNLTANGGQTLAVRYDAFMILYEQASRRELKDNIDDFPSHKAVEYIRKLRPRTFTWKPTPTDTAESAAIKGMAKHVGFIVDEVIGIGNEDGIDLVDWRLPDSVRDFIDVESPLDVDLEFAAKVLEGIPEEEIEGLKELARFKDQELTAERERVRSIVTDLSSWEPAAWKDLHMISLAIAAIKDLDKRLSLLEDKGMI